MYESNLTSVLTKGFAEVTNDTERLAISRALRELSVGVIEAGSFVLCNATKQAELNVAPLEALTLLTTHAADTVVENVMDASTFIKTASSSNYTVADGSLTATAPEDPAVVVSNNVTVTDNSYVVLKVAATLGTGSIEYFVSRCGGTVFTPVEPNDGVILFNQPAGTDFAYKIIVHGDASLQKIGFSLR